MQVLNTVKIIFHILVQRAYFKIIFFTNLLFKTHITLSRTALWTLIRI